MNVDSLQSNKVRWLLTSSILFTLFWLSSAVHAKDDIHERWGLHDPEQTAQVDHNAMSEILNFIVEPGNRFDTYAYYKLTGSGLSYVRQYKNFLTGVPVSQLNKDEQLAFWLNLHNLLVIEKITENLNNSRRMKNRRGTPDDAGKWWSETSVTIDGVSLSINDIEQHILLRHWQEPLIAYGLFYGTRGQAFKGTQAFTGSNVKKRLAKLARDYFKRRDSLRIRKGEVRVNSILAWNKDTFFDNSDEALIAHLKEYATNERWDNLNTVTSVSDDHHFNWSSVTQSPPRQYLDPNLLDQGSRGGYRGGS